MHISSIPFSFSAAVLLPTLLATLSCASPSPYVKTNENQEFLSPTTQWKHNITQDIFLELKELAELTDIAYCIGASGISRPFKCDSHCKKFPNFQLDTLIHHGMLAGYSSGYVAVDHGSTPEDNGRIILSFRGTHSFADAITDLKFGLRKYDPPQATNSYISEISDAVSENLANTDQRPFLTYLGRLFNPKKLAQDQIQGRVDCNKCGVHKGFWDSYERIRPTVIERVTKLHYLYPEYQLHIIGHSLGGAIATLAALEFDAKGYKPIVTTFGQPRVGNEGLKNYINSVFNLQSQNSHGQIVPAVNVGRFRRVTHRNDPVPLLPPQIMGYRSFSGEVFITKSLTPPTLDDLQFCFGDDDLNCIAKKGLISEWPEWSENKNEISGEVKDMTEWENGELKKREKDVDSMLSLGPISSHLSYFLVMGFCIKRFGPPELEVIDA